ncbi:aminotransferase class III-fold pyridoxal phosphate-dependent enzyme [Micrococcales bacterium 31B]|nr:aminotransferase class III-fold pyridoxal phosphate-dependent enzyme [Micrococcales bacterium 31B]
MTVPTAPTQPITQERKLVTAIPGPQSAALHARRLAAVSDGFGIALPVAIESADGGILRDIDGNQLIDFAAGIAVTSVGAANPRVAAAIAEQAAKLTHSCFMVTEYESFVKVCEWLNEHVPGDFEKRTGLFSTGAEAIENAIKVARHATGRPNVLVFDEAYHGRSLLTMAMTAKVMPYKEGFGPFPETVHRAAMANPLRPSAEVLAAIEGEVTPESIAQAALSLVAAKIAELGPETIAAMVIEPIQGEGGFIVPAPGFLRGLRELATQHGIVFVLDEIQAGMGRTGTLFSMEHEGVTADLTTVAKALAAGMPLSAVTGRADLMNAVHAGGLGGTYAGNPMACAAALAVFDEFADGSLLQSAKTIEAVTREVLGGLVLNAPDSDESRNEVADLRGRGAMLALEFADPGTLDKPGTPRPDIAKAVNAFCHERGVLTLTCGTHGNVIRLLPPLVIGEDLLRDGLAVLREAIIANTTK